MQKRLTGAFSYNLSPKIAGNDFYKKQQANSNLKKDNTDESKNAQ